MPADRSSRPAPRLSRERVLRGRRRARRRGRHRGAVDAQARRAARRRGDVALQARRQQGRPARRRWSTASSPRSTCPPAAPTGGRRCASGRSRCATVLQRHRGRSPLMQSRTNPGPSTLRHLDALIGVLRARGLLRRAGRPRASRSSTAYVYGFALQEASLPFDTEERSTEVARADPRRHARRASTRTWPSSPSSTSCSPATTTATSSSSASTSILDGLERARSG